MHTSFLFVRPPRTGFSLVELMVVVSIVTVITLVALVRHSSFNSTTLLNNLSYDIALTIRQAQAYGVSVRNTGQGGNEFSAAYGVHFNALDRSSYLIFQDLNNNNAYDDGEVVETYQLRRSHEIVDVCQNANCFENNGIGELDVVFRRPNPDAIINGSLNSAATITIGSDQGDMEREIEVLATGQISIGAN